MPEHSSLTPEMLLVLAILGLTVVLFVTERWRIDVVALVILMVVGFAGQIPGISPLIDPGLLFSGFSSNAVVSVIAIMILGAGLDKTGLMAQLADYILRRGRQSERHVSARLTVAIGLISSFMQNVGATALFLPVVSRVAARAQIPLSRLLIPVGFCAILGGTLTMVGCSSLIILNDLLNASAQATAQGSIPVHGFDLFDVTPVGIALLGVGVVFFALFGRLVLPNLASGLAKPPNGPEYWEQTYGIRAVTVEAEVASGSPIAGKTIRQIEDGDYAPQILRFSSGKVYQVSPNRDDIVWPGSTLLFLGHEPELKRFTTENRLLVDDVNWQSGSLNSDLSGISEVVVPPGSNWIGRSVGEIRLRKHFSASLLAIYRGENTIQQDLRSQILKSGDTLILYSNWKDLENLARNRDFVIASDYPKDIMRPHKLPHALACFTLAMAMVLFTDMPVAFALLSGALAMVVTGVLNMDMAYQAVSWKTVFLLAGLIPLGIAVENTGTASWLALQIVSLLDGMSVLTMQIALAVLGTLFTLVMSNVGATVLLVPIAISLAIRLGADPSVFALTVALATSNSFLIPTHQVNALIMGPAGYRVADFVRVGGIMSILYLVVLIPMLNWLF